jgi:dsDNA-specific endonuclease/ATPase MutS2
MNQNQTKKMLDWPDIIGRLKEFALSEAAKDQIDNLEISTDYYLVIRRLEETSEARRIYDVSNSIPLHALTGIKNVIEKLGRSEILRPVDLTHMAGFIKDTQKMIRFMSDKEDVGPNLSSYALSMDPLEVELEEITRCIVHNAVADQASGKLYKLRRKMEQLENQIKLKLQSYLASANYSSMLSDLVVSQRDGRYVIPVKSEYKKSIDGMVLDRSRTGGTLFIEPAAVKKMHEELAQLRIDGDNEEYRILSELSDRLMHALRAITINYDTMVTYDFLFAKAKLSHAYRARAAKVTPEKHIKLIGAKHPLLGNEAVPLSMELDARQRNLVITGPNTGGKTVTMKTVGLFIMMTQAGLHVPCDNGTSLPILRQVLCDIGDGQSLQQNLSTFSSHITNINSILELADDQTLVILDEIGAGTDPSEGMGIGIAVLEYLNSKKGFILASTHFNEIKRFAEEHPDFINGSMAFDLGTLKPVYRLEVGKCGESNALLIALRIGMSESLIERAHEIAYNEKVDYKDKLLKETDEHDNHTVLHNSIVSKEDIVEPKSMFRPKPKPKFALGDAVYIHTMKRNGIVCETENSKGDIGVLVLNKKIKVNHKRLSLYLEAEELYPEDYDYDILFKSKEQRKQKKQIVKGKKDVIMME